MTHSSQNSVEISQQRQGAPRFWRSFEELADDDEFANAVRREFPEYANRLNDGATRRQFLQLMGASLALAGFQGCQQPQEKIVAYVRQPEQLIPGRPLYYATSMTHDGAGVGLLVETHSARPTKIEGNPLHPAVPEVMKGAADAANDGRLRFGASDAFSQAFVLSLYDPDRSQTVTRGGQIDTWQSFFAELRRRIEQSSPQGGRGLRILVDTVVSPTLGAQLEELVAQYPEAQWHQYEPINHDNELLGARLAFGQDVVPVYHLDRADTILSLDADFLTEGPQHLQLARAFADRRRAASTPGEGEMNRLYVVESTMTLTGGAADHRLPVGPRGVVDFALKVAGELGLSVPPAAVGGGDVIPPEIVSAVVEDLRRATGRSVVIAGRGQPPVLHALAHWLNEELGNAGSTVEYFPHVAVRPESQVASITSLVEAMRNQEVDSLLILGGNPVYDAPADLKFGEALTEVPFAAHWSGEKNETSAACLWHLPATHTLESWSDTRAFDGTASIIQPLINTLYNTKTIHEVVAAAAGQPQSTSHDLVRGYWQQAALSLGGESGGNFEAFWQTALHEGIISGTASQAVAVTVDSAFPGNFQSELASAPSSLKSDQLQLCFRPDSSVWDGRFATNGWLQELPRPFSKLTWTNAALVSPRVAQDRGLATGDVAEIAVGDAKLRLPVYITPGQPRNTITVALGYGRTRAGRTGTGVGFDVYPLRQSGSLWFADVSEFTKTGAKVELATTQHHFMMDGRDLVKAGTYQEVLDDPAHPAFMAAGHHGPEEPISMYPPFEYNGYKWGMVIDQSACIGCNGCVIACQAENNIPIVGKEQVARGREMHWLRIDQYFEGDQENPASYHQPMLCVHCELAPCEPVCPVEATTHSSEGLNEMTYNRCVGTRYCSNNCPYKVRRFNFLEYNRELRSDPVLQLLPNPDVTIRSRGVMEKCTYCVQRISAARITAEKQEREIRDGEVLTACQAACPTSAIVFGDLNDETSQVARLAKNALNYSVLGELNTRPRTTYLASVRNPHPSLVAAREGVDESAH